MRVSSAVKLSGTLLSLTDNEGSLSNCFSINRLVGQNIILKKQSKTSAKYEFSAIVLNL